MPIPALIGAATSAYGAWQQNRMGKSAAGRQMQFQKHMYKHRYQYQMQDMRRAGLNPILAYSQPPPGGPAGASYQPQNVGAAAVEGATVASAGALKRAETKTAAETARRTRAEVGAVRATTARTHEEARRAKHDADTAETDYKIRGEDWAIRKSEVEIAAHEADIRKTAAASAKALEAYYTEHPYMRVIGAAMGDVGGVLGLAGAGLAGYLGGRGSAKDRADAAIERRKVEQEKKRAKAASKGPPRPRPERKRPVKTNRMRRK